MLCTLSQYMVEPRSVHLIATKFVLRYLKGAINYGLRYASDREISLQGYADSDWAVVSQIIRVHRDVALVWDQL
jgi:hypothetical protein